VKLSVCYIVKNEILKLPESIKHVRELADEICIVDTGSTDGTVQYAKFAADKFAKFKWCDDFSAARNKSLELATGDWILVLDADEWIDESAYPKIRTLAFRTDVEGFLFTIFNFMQDPMWVKKPAVLYGKAIRLFRKGYKYEGIVHNKLNIENPADSGLSVNNFAFKERDTIREKCDRNKKLMEKKIKSQGWTHINCIHYSDIYRKLWTWHGDIKDGMKAVHYLNEALKKQKDIKITQVRDLILKEIEYVKQNRLQNKLNKSA